MIGAEDVNAQPTPSSSSSRVHGDPLPSGRILQRSASIPLDSHARCVTPCVASRGPPYGISGVWKGNQGSKVASHVWYFVSNFSASVLTMGNDVYLAIGCSARGRVDTSRDAIESIPFTEERVERIQKDLRRELEEEIEVTYARYKSSILQIMLYLSFDEDAPAASDFLSSRHYYQV